MRAVYTPCCPTDAGAEKFFAAIPLTYEGYHFSVTFELLRDYIWEDNTIRVKFSFGGLAGKFDVDGIRASLIPKAPSGSTTTQLFTARHSVMLWDGAGLPYFDKSMHDRIASYMRSDPARYYAPDPYTCSTWRAISLNKEA
jgi:hypothetical protein